MLLTGFFRIPICPGGWRDWPTGWQRLPSIWKRPASGLGFLPSASRSRPSTFAIAVIYTHKQTHRHTRTHAQRDKDPVNISAVNRMPNSSSSVARDKLKAKLPARNKRVSPSIPPPFQTACAPELDVLSFRLRSWRCGRYSVHQIKGRHKSNQ
jgi:hypothetical protein